MGWGKVSWGLKGWGWDKKIFPIMRSRDKVKQDHAGQGEDPILRTRLAPLPSLSSIATGPLQNRHYYHYQHHALFSSCLQNHCHQHYQHQNNLQENYNVKVVVITYQHPHQLVHKFFHFAHLKPTFFILHTYFYKTPTSVCLLYTFIQIKYSFF